MIFRVFSLLVFLFVFQSQGKPNVVFMFADDLGYGDLAAYGHPYAETPNLDRLADEGTLFKRFYVTGNWCNPSRVGFLTSRHHATMPNLADHHGYTWRKTITEVFKDAGYATAHFGKWHLGFNWEDQDGNLPAGGVYGMDEIKELGAHGNIPQGRDYVMYEAAMDFITRHKDVPFYVNVMGFVTHYPVKPDPSLAARFDHVTVDRSLFGQQMNDMFVDCENLGGNIDVGMRNYLGDVYGLDLQIGHLLDLLDELGISDNTIVVFSSDNGPAPVGKTILEQYPDAEKNMLGSAGGLRGQKHVDYEGGVREPFIVRYPTVVPGGIVNETSIISALDFLPTLASLAEVPYDASIFEGEDISDIWKGGTRSRTNPIFQNNNGWNKSSSIVQGNWKLFLNPDGSQELYDLASEEHEYNNVLDDHPEILSALRTRLDAWNDTRPENYCRTDCVTLPDPEHDPVIIGPAEGIPMDLDSGLTLTHFQKTSNNPRAMITRVIGTQLELNLPQVQSDIQIFNSRGQLLIKVPGHVGREGVDISGLTSGEYKVQVRLDGYTLNGGFNKI